MLNKSINQCIADMKSIAQSGGWTLDVQVRAYDLLDAIAELNYSRIGLTDEEKISAEQFCVTYDILATSFPAFDEHLLREQASERLQAIKDSANSAAQKAAQLTDLHECAKLTFQIWQTKGLFARQKALRVLRYKAGFRLESKRIGNYVAKTFDLMNEARALYAHAQQTLFLSDVSYKIKPGVYTEIKQRLGSLLSENNPLS